MSNPLFVNQNPVPGFIGVQRSAPIFFRVQDVHGIDLLSLNVSILGEQAIVNGVFQEGYEGSITEENVSRVSISVMLYRLEQFEFCQKVSIHASVNNSQSENGTIDYEVLTVHDSLIEKPLCVATPHGETFNSDFNVQLTCDNNLAEIKYTIDGTNPTLNSQTYVTPIRIINQGITLVKFIGIVDNCYSKIVSENYVLDSIPPVSNATPIGGNFFDSQEITLTVDDPKAKIYYTLNGDMPTTNSLIYSSPIKIKDNCRTVVKFFAVDEAGNKESFHTETYNIEIAKNNFVPTNVFVSCPFSQKQLHINWDDMNSVFEEVIGYNIYRADVEIGPYEKINTDIVSITQFDDKTLDSSVIREDVSEQFKRTVNVSKEINDSFKIPGKFDLSKWNEDDPAELLFQYDGVIFKDATGLRQTSKITSKFKLRGNFDIRLKFDLFTWISPSSGTQACKFVIKKDENNSVEISRSMSKNSDVYCGQQIVNSNQDLPFTASTTERSGEFKITRQDDTINTYYYDNSLEDFVLFGTYNDYLEDVNVEISGKSEDKQIEFRLFNFTVNFGNAIIIEPLNPRKEYVIYLSQRPVVDDSGSNNSTDDSKFVTVTIDDQKAYVRKLQGLEGLIELETEKVYDDVKKQYFAPPVPNEFSKVIVSYRIPSHITNISLMKNYFYKVSCVTSNDETDLDLIKPQTLQSEQMTYMFEEAVRRNSWLLDQGGEQVLLYIKRRAGVKCHCTYRDMKERTHKQPDQDCETCFGSGFVGGYDGPFPILIGPLTTEKRIQQTDRGLSLVYQIETWTGPTPIITQRDMIVRRNGDRCLVGPLTPVEGPGGVKVQQHFSVEVLNGTDIRYKFEVVLPGQKIQPGINKTSKHVLNMNPNIASIESPKEREELRTSENKISSQNVNTDHIVKGRSITFENIEY